MSMAMKAKTIGYWVATGLVAFAMGAGGAFDVLNGPDVVTLMAHLGYAPYVAPLLGFWKVFGAVVVLAPRLPRLKEWAYAGIVFDLSGAAVSHAASHDPLSNVLTPLVILAIAVASWALRPESRRLQGPMVLGGKSSAGIG
jgi:hypothetical protein